MQLSSLVCHKTSTVVITGPGARPLPTFCTTTKRLTGFMYLGALGFPGGSDGKESAYNTGEPGSTPGSGRCSGEGNSNPFHYSCLQNSMDGEAWWTTVHVVAKSQTWLSNEHFEYSDCPPSCYFLFLFFSLLFLIWMKIILKIVSKFLWPLLKQ